MTVIVGLRAGRSVIIGGDSTGMNPSTLESIPRSDTKVFRMGPFIMGVTGSFRSAQIIQHRAHFDDPPIQNPDPWMETHFIPQIREAFKSAEWHHSRKTSAEMLVGFDSKLYRVLFNDWQYCATLHNYDAIGSGGDLALGALFATQPSRIIAPVEPVLRVWTALEAATHHNAGVRPPFIIANTALPYCPITWNPGQGEALAEHYRNNVGAKKT